MKAFRLAALALVCSTCCLGASKEIVELQRDVELLQDQIKTIQRTLDEKFAQLQTLLQVSSDTTKDTNTQLHDLGTSVSRSVGTQLAPVTNLNQHVESVGEDVRALKDSLADVESRLDKLDAKITDVQRTMQIQQNPPQAPPPSGSTDQPGAMQPGATGQPGMPGGPVAPPPGMSADQSFTAAVHDNQTGNNELALKEFQDYLTYFPNTALAPNAQYYIGEINFNQGNYNDAIRAFDAVLERYPAGPKTPDAHYMKGRALLKSGQRTRAVQEFRDLIANYKGTNAARNAQDQLRQLNAAAPPRKH
ncbi:MAG TPA: tetratricopeptide repeat protein [Bryobacteraceae bacterium]|jgi:tol-pal system protein YbgF|nr:tetratricopeptide repeat protein [Bryobacteraceae bacterium]